MSYFGGIGALLSRYKAKIWLSSSIEVLLRRDIARCTVYHDMNVDFKGTFPVLV